MKSTLVRSAAALLALAALQLGASAQAHHAFSYFDMDKDVKYEGAVVTYRWENPHIHIIIKVPPTAADPATAGTWDVEGGSVNIMHRQGWSKGTFKVGDKITVVGHPMRDNSKGASLFYVIMPDGTKLYHDIARPKE
jgi:hypothetical protein